MLSSKRNKKISKKTFFAIIALIIIIAFASYSSITLLIQMQLVKQKVQLKAMQSRTDSLVAAAKEARKKAPVYINLPSATPVRAIVDNYSSPSSLWAIASKNHSLPVDYAPQPLKIPAVETRTDKSDSERSVRADIEEALISMFNQAKSEGYNLVIGSGYRSAALQKTYFDNYARSVGEAAANLLIAYPGQSEHQTGLAVDITTVSRDCYLNECFAGTNDGTWLAENSYKFGFILRYPKGKENITGYQYEPWHFRYVGVDLATALYKSGLTLDEAWQYLDAAHKTLKENGAIQD